MTLPLNRRDFIGTGLAAGLATGWGAALAPALGAALDPESAKKTMLILGGTRFLGPQIVRAAKESGYEVTLFNRGKSNPHLFPDLEKIRGDRNLDELDGLVGRSFDVVVDTSGYVPRQVKKAVEILGPGCKQYIFVSTVSVYAEGDARVFDESSPVTVLDAEVLEKVKTIRESFPHYSGMKAHSEKAAEAAAPGKVLSIRPGLIVGPHDSSDRFTYWPARVARGGEILAPGVREASTQFIDVRDLGEWTVRCADARLFGIFNAVGFRGVVTMEELLYGSKLVIGSDCKFTWVSEEFLAEQQVQPWSELPLWIPEAGNRSYKNETAIAAGLTFRPVAETVRDTLAWHLEERGTDYAWRGKLTPEKEAKVLAAWHARGS